MPRDGETTPETPAEPRRLTDFEIGLLVGVLVGEGHFGGDGRQPQVTLRMHTRHLRLFEWLRDALPGSRLYGPYHHGGRSYYQWMARGDYLRQHLAPLLAGRLEAIDEPAATRFRDMCRNYGIVIDNWDPGPAQTPTYNSA